MKGPFLVLLNVSPNVSQGCTGTLMLPMQTNKPGQSFTYLWQQSPLFKLEFGFLQSYN